MSKPGIVIFHQLVIGFRKEVADLLPRLLCSVMDHYVHREHVALPVK